MAAALLALSGALAAFALGGIPALAAAAASLALTAACMPLYRAYAMARPNARSSHLIPVPQGGGATVVLATLAACAFGLAISSGGAPALTSFAFVAVAAGLLAAIGAIDDIASLPVLPRLGAQIGAVALAIYGASDGRQILPLPWGIEFALLVVAGTWFVNLTNFMDGIDGITLAGFMPLAFAAGLAAWLGMASFSAGILAACFLGALAGFVPFNVPRARLFLGDVGSLPIGLIGGVLIYDLAQSGAFAAAIILPLYHFTDATLTLLSRLLRRERVWEAHRQHAYQRAVDAGWPHARVSAIVLALNLTLVGLSLLTIGLTPVAQGIMVAVAFAAVLGVIVLFRTRTRSTT